MLTKEEHRTAREGALLAKADLTTLMVREFPELQGVMGGLYLDAEGPQRAAVARAVRWHYHPLSIDEAAPPKGSLEAEEANVFGAVSLADKLDTLAGYFALGSDAEGQQRSVWPAPRGPGRDQGPAGLLGRPRQESILTSGP